MKNKKIATTIKSSTFPPCRYFNVAFLILFLILISSTHSLPNDLTSKWTNKVIPLPKQMSVTGSVELQSNKIVSSLPKSSHILFKTINELLKPIANGSSGFTIKLVLVNENSSECPGKLVKSLNKLPNKDQAYAIQPIEEHGEFNGLLLAANTPLGLLYGTRTLTQLILGSTDPHETIEIPEVTILDWPDIPERGEWGWNMQQDKYGLAGLKMNEIEHHANLGFSNDGSPTASIDKILLKDALGIGITVVPIISHMEQLARTGIFKYYPEIASVFEPGKPLPTDYEPNICFSHPKTKQLLAGWMQQLLAFEGVNEINAWLAEMGNPCFCEHCKDKDPFVLQTIGLVDAFELVKESFPGAHLRILLTQASYKSNDKILAACKPETRITYYHGSKTYDSSRKPMIYPLLEDYAKSGRWLGVYPQLTNSWRTIFPFTGPQFIQARMQEFANKGLNSVCGYATPANCYYDFNIAASAEWSWNSSGRTPREFARAYATKIDLPDPDLFAEWAEIIGEIGWNVAGSRIVEKLIFNAGETVFIDGLITDGAVLKTEKPLEFGEGILTEFNNQNELQQNIAIAEKALNIATLSGVSRMINESQSVLDILQLAAGLKEFSDLLNLKRTPAAKEIEAILDKIDKSAKSLTNSIYRWGMEVNPVEREALASRFRDNVDFAATIAGMMREIVKELKINDPCPEYRFQPVAQWNDTDFSDTTDATLWADITEQLSGAGEYDIRFLFTDGKSGIRTKSVSLLYGPTKKSARTMFTDRWDFKLSRFDRYIEYWLKIPSQPDLITSSKNRWFIRAEITGPALELPKDRRTSQGTIFLRRSWRD